MTTKTKSVRFLKEVAKKNSLLCSITDKHCVFGYSKESLENNISEYNVRDMSIENSYFYIKEYMFNAMLDMGGDVDEWFDNASGLVSIRFCLDEQSMCEATVVVSDIFQTEMVESLSLEEVLIDMLGLDTEVDDMDDVDYKVVKELVDSMTPADLLCIYYVVAKRHWED